MNIKNDKLCEGCKTFSNCFFSYTNVYTLDTENCPCQTCLVKQVCVNYCDEYDKFHNDQKELFGKIYRYKLNFDKKRI